MKRLIHKRTHEMVVENSENTPGYFLPVSSLGFYSNAFPSDWGNQIQIPFKKMRLQNLDRGSQHTHKENSKFLSLHHKDPAPYSGIYWGNQIPIPFKKMRFQNLDRVNRLTHEESCEFISLDQKVRQNEAEQNQQGSFLVLPHYLAQFRNNNSEKIKASPEFQSLEAEGHQEKVEPVGFKPLIVESTQENDSEKFKLTKFQIEFQKRLSLNHKSYQEKNRGFQPLIVSGSPSKENLSEQFRLNPKFEWARLDRKDEQEQNLQEGFQLSKENNSEQFRLLSSEFPSLPGFEDAAQFRDDNSEKIKASPEFQSLEPEGRQEKVEQQGFRPLIVKSTQENDAEKFRLISSEFPSLPGFEEESKGFQLFSTQPKDQQVRFQPSNLLALEIFEQNKSIPEKDKAQFGEIGSVNWFLNQPNFKPYRKPAL